MDLFQVKPEFRFKEESEHAKSTAGKIFTTILVLGILFIAAWVAKETFTRENPVVDVSSVILEDPPELLINSQTFPIAIGLEDPTFRPYADPSIYQIKLS